MHNSISRISIRYSIVTTITLLLPECSSLNSMSRYSSPRYAHCGHLVVTLDAFAWIRHSLSALVTFFPFPAAGTPSSCSRVSRMLFDVVSDRICVSYCMKGKRKQLIIWNGVISPGLLVLQGFQSSKILPGWKPSSWTTFWPTVPLGATRTHSGDFRPAREINIHPAKGKKDL